MEEKSNKNLKIILIGFVAIAIVILVLIGYKASRKSVSENNIVEENEISKENIEDSQDEGVVIRVGYLNDNNPMSKNMVISDYDEFVEIFSYYLESIDDLKQFDEEYFETQNLAIVYVETTSGGDVVTFRRAKTSGKKIRVDYNVDTSKGITDDMSGFLIFVKCSKKIEEVGNTFNVK